MQCEINSLIDIPNNLEGEERCYPPDSMLLVGVQFVCYPAHADYIVLITTYVLI